MSRIDLRVKLPRKRTLPGKMEIIFDGRLLRTVAVLGLGTKSETGDTSILNGGNTPRGSYLGSAIRTHDKVPVDSSIFPVDSYGYWGEIKLSPVGGEALHIERKFRRSGLLIHGGPPGTRGGLKNTQGCLRVSNRDMFFLRMTLLGDPQKVCLSKPRISVTVSE